MAEGAKGTPGFASAPHVVTVAGGVPIFSADGKTRIGAVGASGEAPEDDAACVTAGIAAAGPALDPSLSKRRHLSMGGACKRFIPMRKQRSTGC